MNNASEQPTRKQMAEQGPDSREELIFTPISLARARLSSGQMAQPAAPASDQKPAETTASPPIPAKAAAKPEPAAAKSSPASSGGDPFGCVTTSLLGLAFVVGGILGGVAGGGTLLWFINSGKVVIVAEATPPTATPLPTATQPAPTAIVATGTPATPTTAPVNTGTKCLQMEFLGDINVPPGTVFKSGAKFTKTWRVRNSGTCKWTADFDITLIGGDALGTNKRGDISRDVLPGDTVDISIDMVAPQTEGTYYSYWMVIEPGGARFGLRAGPGSLPARNE